MTLQDLFDELLVARTVTVELDKSQAESLRVALSKKWSKYRKLMDSCGFLEEELKTCGIRRTGPDSETGTYTFLLAPTVRLPIQYTVLSSTTPTEQQPLAS